MKVRIGIDPGDSGACVAIFEDRTVKWIQFEKSTQKEIWLFIEELIFHESFCILELVNSMPNQGVSSSFKFGRNTGFVIGLLVASGIPYEEKVPRMWQKALGITPRFIPKEGESGVEESKTEFKKRLKQKAEQLYPSLKVTTDTADALLIADFCKRLKP